MTWPGCNFVARFRLKNILHGLKSQGMAPDKIEIVAAPGGFFANIAFGEVDPVISENVATGFDKNADIAVLKAISEFIERRAFRHGKQTGAAFCQTERSDGFAAFPRSWHTEFTAHSDARTRALHEATERYVWAHWWDSPTVAHWMQDARLYASQASCETALLNALPAYIDLEKIIAVVPKIKSSNRVLVILLCELKNGGFLSGGACGFREHRKEIFMRASAELFRHALAHFRLNQTKRLPNDFYQERLAYFCTPEGGQEVRKRIAMQGTDAVNLPDLEIDAEIPHCVSNLVLVHRCLYKNQPLFMGGKMNRFCI